MSDRHEPGSDPLDALRSAWSGLEPPRRSEDLDETDPRTQEAVRWLRFAWSTVEAPPVDPATVFARRSPALRAFPTRPVAVVAAAAALILVALGFLWRSSPSAIPRVDTDGSSGLASAGSASDSAHGGETQEPREAGVAEPLRLAAVSADHLELTSGPVRLILITNDPAAATDAGNPR